MRKATLGGHRRAVHEAQDVVAVLLADGEDQQPADVVAQLGWPADIDDLVVLVPGGGWEATDRVIGHLQSFEDAGWRFVRLLPGVRKALAQGIRTYGVRMVAKVFVDGSGRVLIGPHLIDIVDGREAARTDIEDSVLDLRDEQGGPDLSDEDGTSSDGRRAGDDTGPDGRGRGSERLTASSLRASRMRHPSSLPLAGVRIEHLVGMHHAPAVVR